jgi:Na+/melibiose symporter-like transporter
MPRVRLGWAYRYSVVSFTLVAMNFVVSFVFMSRWLLGPALTPTSPQVQRLVSISLVLDSLAVAFSILAIRKESPKNLAYIALLASLVTIVLCGARFAV